MSERARGETPESTGDRGQLVLVAAFVLALALVSLGIAYLQLGYNDDVTSPGQEPAAQLETVLERALHAASADVPDTYGWNDRDEAVRAFRDELNGTVETLETSRLADGHVYHVSLNESRAAEWLSANCPRGPNREFGNCATVDGVVIQERDERTHVLAVAFDLGITRPDGATTARITIERQPT